MTQKQFIIFHIFLYLYIAMVVATGAFFNLSQKAITTQIDYSVYNNYTLPTPKVAKPEEEPMRIVYKFGSSDMNLLARLIRAEAGDMDLHYKLLIGRVVLNQLESGKWGDTLEEVIYYKNNFSVVKNGKIDKTVPNGETMDALTLLLCGWDESEGATYFRVTTDKPNWHDDNLTKLFEYENASFYKE